MLSWYGPGMSEHDGESEGHNTYSLDQQELELVRQVRRTHHPKCRVCIYSKAMNAISLGNNDLRSKELAHDLVDAELRMLWVAPARRQEKVFWLPSLYRARCVRERRNTCRSGKY